MIGLLGFLIFSVFFLFPSDYFSLVCKDDRGRQRLMQCFSCLWSNKCLHSTAVAIQNNKGWVPAQAVLLQQLSISSFVGVQLQHPSAPGKFTFKPIHDRRHFLSGQSAVRIEHDQRRTLHTLLRRRPLSFTGDNQQRKEQE